VCVLCVCVMYERKCCATAGGGDVIVMMIESAQNRDSRCLCVCHCVCNTRVSSNVFI